MERDPMRYLGLLTIPLVVLLCDGMTLVAQESGAVKPEAAWDVLRMDVGSWDVEIKTWAGPGEPTVTQGKETNRMLGEHWLLTDFQGNMMGLEFSGHGTYSYDEEKKQYFGTWIDSLSPGEMEMIGKHDPAKQTMVYEGMAPGPDGKLAKHVIATTYKHDGTRVMTMHMQSGEDMIKIFEMTYTKATGMSASNSSK